MITAHAKLLLEQTNCPACGAAMIASARDDRDRLTQPIWASVTFECSAHFVISDGQIIVSTPCPAPSHTAAMLMNHQAEEAKQESERQTP